MSEAFNPYRAWLGVTSDSQPPNHYELLGLPLLRAEPGEVAAAFQRQVSRLSPYLLGEQASTAQIILSELASAKVELLTPTTKRIYDASLAAGKQASSKPAPPPTGLSAATSPQPPAKTSNIAKPSDSAASDDWLPPAADPTLASTYMSGRASEPPAVAPANQPLPPTNQPLPPAHQPLPQAAVMARPAPAAAVPIYGYQQPYGQANYGGGAPAYQAPAYHPAPYSPAPAHNRGTSSLAAVEPALSPSVGAPATSVAQSGLRRQSSPVPMVVGVLVAGFLMVAVGFYAVKLATQPAAKAPSAQQAPQPQPRGRDDKPRPRAPRQHRSLQSGEHEQTRPAEGATKPRLSDQPWPPKGDPAMVADPDCSSEPAPEMSGPAKPASTQPASTQPAPAKPDASKPDASKPEPAKPEPAKTEMPAKTEPENPVPPAEATPQQVAATKRALTAARTALGKRDLETAQEQLDLATLDAVTPDLDAEVSRVGLLTKYVEHFWKAVGETLPKLEVGEEFNINGTIGGVVEGRADMLVIRVQGRNREFSLYELPSKLAVMLAQRWLDKDDAQTPVVIGAFLLADPKGDDQEARRLFQQAAAKGVDVAPLIQELESREQ